jgi:hypothetical protein
MEDDTYKHNVRNNQSDMRADLDNSKRKLGVCVQCKDHCDCGVNEYCAVDWNKQIPNWSLMRPENMGFGLTAIQKKMVEVWILFCDVAFMNLFPALFLAHV